MASATNPKRKRKAKSRRKAVAKRKTKAAAKSARGRKVKSAAKSRRKTKTKRKAVGGSKRTPKAKAASKAKTKSKSKAKTKPAAKRKAKTTPKAAAKTSPKAAPPRPRPRAATPSPKAEAPPQHLFAAILDRVYAACAAALGPQADLSRVLVEPPRDPTHGDMATNAAMVLAKGAGLNPRDFAEKIAVALRADPRVEKVDIAGPGFINLTLKPHVWGEALLVALDQSRGYGRSDMGQGAKVNVEYVSANPTGPMHVGHCRGAVFGDALASLLKFAGYEVTREYYINDAGAQVDVLARSAYLRYREALGEPIGAIPEGFIPANT